MICYNSNKQFKLTCQCATKALHFAHDFASKDVRLFFLWGKALNGLQEWDSATKTLKTALRLATRNSEKTDIGKELAHADKKQKEYQDRQRQQFQGMFGTSNAGNRDLTEPRADVQPHQPATIVEIKDNEAETEQDDMFEKMMEIDMTEFKMAEGVYEQNLGVTAEFNKDEIELLKRLAKKIGLNINVDKNIVISKTI